MLRYGHLGDVSARPVDRSMDETGDRIRWVAFDPCSLCIRRRVGRVAIVDRNTDFKSRSWPVVRRTDRMGNRRVARYGTSENPMEPRNSRSDRRWPVARWGPCDLPVGRTGLKTMLLASPTPIHRTRRTDKIEIRLGRSADRTRRLGRFETCPIERRCHSRKEILAPLASQSQRGSTGCRGSGQPSRRKEFRSSRPNAQETDAPFRTLSSSIRTQRTTRWN